jgi:RNA polymerase sigma factor (sigma-70 family)
LVQCTAIAVSHQSAVRIITRFIAPQLLLLSDRHILIIQTYGTVRPAWIGMKPKTVSAFATFAKTAAERYGAELHRFLARRTHRPQEVEDLAQEVYIRLLKIDAGEFVQNPRAYILQTASNLVHDFIEKDRRAKQHVVVDSEVLEQASENPLEPRACDLAQRISTQKQLNAAIAQLAPIHAAVLLMYYREGYSYDEIANQLKVSLRQVKRYIAHAKKALMQLDWDWD